MRPSRLSIILILIVVLVIGVGVIGWIYATPRPAMSDANDAAAPKAIEYTQEELSAQVAHDAVASWVSHCMKVPSFHSLPEEYIAMFNVHNYLPYLTPAAITHPVTVDPNLISQQQQEVVSISKILYIQRSVLDKSVSNMAKWSIELQWVIIAIGLSTTAVVAINAIDI
ncbi:MAG TPA: hypothetical protein VET89_12425 [Stellaceae bacterium]|nr:hypothetical protein [Stellaceae bacterium]